MTIAMSVGLVFAAILGAYLFVLWFGSATVIDKHEDRITVMERRWAETFGGPKPAVEDGSAELLAEPHLSSLAGGSEDLADLFPRCSASLGVPGLSGDFTTQRGVEDLQGVQGVQLARDVTEVVRQPVEDRGTEFIADHVVVPVGDHEVSENVPQPAEGFPGAVVPGSVVVDGESGDRHAVKGGLTTSTCQDGFDDDTDEFPVAPETVPDGMPLAVQSALIERPSPVPRGKSAEWVEEAIKGFNFTGRRR